MRLSSPVQCGLLAALLAVPCAAHAEAVHLPLAIPQSYIAAISKSHLFTLKGEAMRLNDDGSGCQYLELSRPAVSIQEGVITIKANAEARVGRLLGQNCVLVLDWAGGVEVDQTLVADDAARVLRARVKDVRVYDSDGNRTAASSVLWQWAQQYVKGAFDVAVVDLNTPLSDINRLLPQFFVSDARLGTAPQINVRMGDVKLERGAVTTDLYFDPPPRSTAPPPAAQRERTLTPAEAENFQARLDVLDGFFTYVIKKAVRQDTDGELRARLFDALIETRYAINDALVNPVPRGARDPIRMLFVQQWNELAPLVASAAGQSAEQSPALNYVAFAAGADALAALDKLGPEYGVEISSDGLRRLARLLAPDEQADPTAYSEARDAELSRDFDLGFEPDPAANELLPWLMDVFITPAYGAKTVDPAVLKKLNNWVPKRDDMEQYLPLVHGVIDQALAEVLKKKTLAAEFVPVYRATVIAAAWQESCWRQFVADKGKRMPLRSGQGDIGMMQVNPRIWRGFYEAHGLKWDISYNAHAGADILLHYFKNYAVKKAEHKITGKLDNLGRATYSAYNGGPRQLTRYRSKGASEHGKKVDKAFNEKFRIVRSGNEMAVQGCYSGG